MNEFKNDNINYVSINLEGGLGNQLFKIFCLISYCLKHNKKFILPRLLPKNDKRKTYWNNIFKSIYKYTYNSNYKFNHIYNEKNFFYNDIPFITTSLLLKGYFQSYKYFKDNFDIIFNILNIKNMQSNIGDKYLKYNNTIGVHFRLGDYKTLKNNPILSIEYYINSIKYIIHNTQINDYNILYACEKDDDNTVSKNINILQDKFPHLKFHKINNEIEDWEQMLLMSICKHNIIANSTFSWWSGYLNRNKNKIICYPNMWFNIKKYNIKDMFIKGWIKI